MATPDTNLRVIPKSSCAPHSQGHIQPATNSCWFNLLDISRVRPSSPSQTHKTQIRDFFLFGSAASIVAPPIYTSLEQLLSLVFLNSNPIMSFLLMAPLSPSRHIPCSISCPCCSLQSHLLTISCASNPCSRNSNLLEAPQTPPGYFWPSSPESCSPQLSRMSFPFHSPPPSLVHFFFSFCTL